MLIELMTIPLEIALLLARSSKPTVSPVCPSSMCLVHSPNLTVSWSMS